MPRLTRLPLRNQWRPIGDPEFDVDGTSVSARISSSIRVITNHDNNCSVNSTICARSPYLLPGLMRASPSRRTPLGSALMCRDLMERCCGGRLMVGATWMRRCPCEQFVYRREGAGSSKPEVKRQFLRTSVSTAHGIKVARIRQPRAAQDAPRLAITLLPGRAGIC